MKQDQAFQLAYMGSFLILMGAANEFKVSLFKLNPWLFVIPVFLCLFYVQHTAFTDNRKKSTQVIGLTGVAGLTIALGTQMALPFHLVFVGLGVIMWIPLLNTMFKKQKSKKRV